MPKSDSLAESSSDYYLNSDRGVDFTLNFSKSAFSSFVRAIICIFLLLNPPISF